MWVIRTLVRPSLVAWGRPKPDCSAVSREERTRKGLGKEQGAVRNSISRERWGPGGNRGVREDLEEVTQDMEYPLHRVWNDGQGRICTLLYRGWGGGGGQGWALRNLGCLEHGLCECG